jgi:hypothetical protein
MAIFTCRQRLRSARSSVACTISMRRGQICWARGGPGPVLLTCLDLHPCRMVPLAGILGITQALQGIDFTRVPIVVKALVSLLYHLTGGDDRRRLWRACESTSTSRTE